MAPRKKLIVFGERAQRGLLIREVDENGVQVGHVQDFAGAGIQVNRVQFGVTLASGIESTHQLANAGAVQVGHIAKIQKNAAASIFE